MVRLPGRQSTGIKIGIHYAWIIIAIAGVMHMAGGSVRQAFGVLIVPLQEDMGWNPAAVTLAYSLASIVGAVLAPISGTSTGSVWAWLRHASRYPSSPWLPIGFGSGLDSVSAYCKRSMGWARP